LAVIGLNGCLHGHWQSLGCGDNFSIIPSHWGAFRLICNFAGRGICDQIFSWQGGSNQGIVGVDIDWIAILFTARGIEGTWQVRTPYFAEQVQ
jgi:hypothetical protein